VLSDRRILVDCVQQYCYCRSCVQGSVAYRKAAWAIEDLEQDVGLIYRRMGRKGLEGIENVGPRLADAIEGLLAELSVSPAGCERPSLPG